MAAAHGYPLSVYPLSTLTSASVSSGGQISVLSPSHFPSDCISRCHSSSSIGCGLPGGSDTFMYTTMADESK